MADASQPPSTPASSGARLPAAVLWDMDGTLVDTEPCWIAEEYALVESFGGTWNDQRARRLVGFDLLAAAEILRDVGGVDMTPRAIVEHLSAGVIERVRGAVPWRPGARELLAETVAAATPCALVTMSWTDLAGAVVAALPDRTFDAVITGDQVPRGKPFPDPYELAAASLGVPPATCLAIEDSPTGVTSAVRAGVPTLAVPNAADVPEQPGVVRIESLDGIGLADLARVHAEAHASRTRALAP